MDKFLRWLCFYLVAYANLTLGKTTSEKSYEKDLQLGSSEGNLSKPLLCHALSDGFIELISQAALTSQYDYLEPFLTDLKLSQSLFLPTLNGMSIKKDNIIVRVGICDSLSKLYNLVDNSEILNLIDFLKRKRADSNLKPSHKQLAMLSFLLNEPGMGLSPSIAMLSEKKTDKVFKLRLRNGGLLSAKSSAKMTKTMIEKIEDAKLIYVGDSTGLSNYVLTLPKGVYTLSMGAPIFHTVSLQVNDDQRIRFFDPSSGTINATPNEYFASLNKHFKTTLFRCDLTGYGNAARSIPLQLALTPWAGSLLTAINAQDLEGIEQILAAAPQLLTAPDLSAPPVHAAVAREKLDSLRCLVENGADPNTFDANGKTPLIFSLVEKKPFFVVQALIECGADPNLSDRLGHVPLLLVVSSKDSSVEVVNALLNVGADPLVKDREDSPLIGIAIAYASPEIVARLLQDPRVDPNMKITVKSRTRGRVAVSLLEIAKQFKREDLVDVIKASQKNRKTGSFVFAPGTRSRTSIESEATAEV